MAERITTVKMTATRNRSEHLNASRKDGGRKETNAVVSVLRVGGENKHFPWKLLDVGCFYFPRGSDLVTF